MPYQSACGKRKRLIPPTQDPILTAGVIYSHAVGASSHPLSASRRSPITGHLGNKHADLRGNGVFLSPADAENAFVCRASHDVKSGCRGTNVSALAFSLCQADVTSDDKHKFEIIWRTGGSKYSDEYKKEYVFS